MNKRKTLNSWVLAAFYLGGLVWVTGLYKCTMNEVQAYQKMALEVSQNLQAQRHVNTDIYAEILETRLSVFATKYDIEIIKKMMGLDGYHIELVPILVPGNTIEKDLPKGWKHDYFGARPGN